MAQINSISRKKRQPLGTHAGFGQKAVRISFTRASASLVGCSGLMGATTRSIQSKPRDGVGWLPVSVCVVASLFWWLTTCAMSMGMGGTGRAVAGHVRTTGNRVTQAGTCAPATVRSRTTGCTNCWYSLDRNAAAPHKPQKTLK